MIRVAIDIGGVLSKYPEVFLPLVRALHDGGAEVHVVTDMHARDDTLDILRRNGFGFIPADRVHNSDFETYGEACKAVILRRLEIDVFIDDFPAYLAEGCPVRLLVQPDLSRPYYHDSWRTNGNEGEFGRRRRVERYAESGRYGGVRPPAPCDA